MASRRSPHKSTKTSFSRSTSRHILYQHSVQDPGVEIRFVGRAFKKLRGRKALALREDFCGTALFCAEWIKSDRRRTAVGIDLDPDVLDWGREHNLKALSEPGSRIQLLQQDVRDKVKGPFDIAVGFNFSYWVFRTRDELRSYFESVRTSLGPDGLFFVDAYGGYESMMAGEDEIERRKVKPNGSRDFFYYLWDQAALNPIDHSVVNHIHFEFRNGHKWRKAFTYEWRFWTLPEIQEVLLEAGFKRSTVYWEDADDDGDGTGTYRPRKVVENDPAWVAYVMAER